MANISTYLSTIKNAVYGRDMRTAIHDSIEAVNTDLNGKEPSLTKGTASQYFRGDKTLSTFADDVRNATLTGLSTSTSSPISSSLTMIAAMGRLQAQINTINSSFSNNVLNTPLTGFNTLAAYESINENTMLIDAIISLQMQISSANTNLNSYTFNISSEISKKVSKSGDIMTGSLTFKDGENENESGYITPYNNDLVIASNGAVIIDGKFGFANSVSNLINGFSFTVENDNSKLITSAAVYDALQGKADNNHLGVKSDDELKSVTETGFYTYETNSGDVQNLIVQMYADYYIVQYKITENNILRRYISFPLTDNLWTGWNSISKTKYDPNSDYIAGHSAIAAGVKDNSKYGLKIGDVLNGQYGGLSEHDLAYFQENNIRDNKAKPDYTFDLTDEGLLVDGKTADSSLIVSSAGYSSDKGCWHGRGLAVDLAKLEEIYGAGCIIKVYIKASYDDTTVAVNDENFYVFPTSTDTVSITSSTKCISFYVGDTDYKLDFSVSNWLWLNKIEIYTLTNSVGFREDYQNIYVQRGNSVGLLNALALAPDGAKVYIPSGIYNIGILDQAVNSINDGKINITQSNLSVIGEGIDKTFITGTYLTCSGVTLSALKVTGNNCLFKDFTIETHRLNGQVQAPTVIDAGSDTLWYNVGFIGGQDTLVTHTGSQYYKNCYIEGNVDFICGGAADKLSYFDGCTLGLKGRSIANVIAAPTGNFVFESCTIQDNENYEFESQNGRYSLGRAWISGSNSPTLIYNETHFVVKPSETNPYTSMSSDGTIQFANYGDTNGTGIDWTDINNYHTPANTDILSNISSYFNNLSDIQSKLTNIASTYNYKEIGTALNNYLSIDFNEFDAQTSITE